MTWTHEGDGHGTFAVSLTYTRRMESNLRAQGFDSLAIDVSTPETPTPDWAHVRGAVLGASVHEGKHQAAALTFARRHGRELNARPSAFFSVSLAAASSNPQEIAAARRLAEGFTTAAQWQPLWTVCVAGRLAYTRYGLFKRLLMRWIAKREGGPTDTSRDHELTDWAAVARLANQMADAVRHTQPAPSVRSFARA